MKNLFHIVQPKPGLHQQASEMQKDYNGNEDAKKISE